MIKNKIRDTLRLSFVYQNALGYVIQKEAEENVELLSKVLEIKKQELDSIRQSFENGEAEAVLGSDTSMVKEAIMTSFQTEIDEIKGSIKEWSKLSGLVEV